MNYSHLGSYLIFHLLCFGNTTLPAQPAPIPGYVLVELQPNFHPDDFLKTWNTGRSPSETLKREKTLSLPLNIHLFKTGNPDLTPPGLLENLDGLEMVRAAQWDYPLDFHAVPDDPGYPNQWSFPHVGADIAWDQTTGGLTASGDTIVVAILDGGFDVAHPDLAPNIWVNRGEIAGDGLDNDANGLTDDYRGWNFADDSPGHPLDLHGTSVAGIIGAAGNNATGMTGMNWHLKMMLFTTQNVSDVVEAYSYILDQRQLYQHSGGEKGALVVATNASFGVAGVFCEQQAVWGGMYDRLGQAGILTAVATVNEPVNVEVVGDMPSSCPSPFLVTVLQTDHQDAKDPSSGFGALSIDMGAPGTGIYTTQPGNKYGYFQGTSAAAPHVCGAIALLFSIPCQEFAEGILAAPQQSALMVRNALLEGVLPMPALEGLTQTGGRLSVDRSLDYLEEQCEKENPGGLEILNIFPNPSEEGVQIEFQSDSQKDIQYRLTNAIGQTALEGSLPGSPWPVKHLYLPLGSLPKGCYMIGLSDGRYQVSKVFFLF